MSKSIEKICYELVENLVTITAEATSRMSMFKNCRKLTKKDIKRISKKIIKDIRKAD